MNSKKNGIIPYELLSTADEIRGLELLKGKYSDTWDLYELAEEKLMESEHYKDTVFYVDGFAGFTGREKSLVKTLLKKTEGLVITLACDMGERGDSYVFSNTLRTLEELKALSNEAGGTFELEVCQPSSDNGELSFLRDHFYSYPTVSYKGKPEKIVLFEAKNRFSEIENAAGEILRLADEKKYRFRDMGIICDMSIYGEEIRRIFADYQIPCFIDQKRAISGSATVRYVLSALETIKRNMRYEDVFSYLKTGLSGIDSETVEKLENHVLERGIRGSLWSKPFDVDRLEFGDVLEEARIKLWGRFSTFKAKMEKAENIRGFVEVLYEFLVLGEVENKTESFVEKLIQEGDFEYASEYSQIWNIIMEIFDQLIE